MTAPSLIEITLHKKSQLLELRFDNGDHFELSSEFLRVHSPSAEVRGHSADQAVLQVGKEQVKIVELKPVGNYGISPLFSDGHDSGIFTWQELHRLGREQDALWSDYLRRLKASGHQRSEARSE